MLRFFRRIRERLLEEGKFRSYFLYGLGEILLVVIGILIAFQIDNWNEERIKRGQEYKVLSQVKADLIENKQEIESIVASLEGSTQAADSLIQSFDEEKRVPFFAVYISFVHRKFIFNNSVSGYSLLGGTLGTLVREDSVRNNIVQLYEADLTTIVVQEKNMFDFIDNNLIPQTNRLFEIDTDTEINAPWLDNISYDIYSPINFDQLTKNLEYINTIKVLKKTYEIRLDHLYATHSRIEKVINQIDSELNELS